MGITEGNYKGEDHLGITKASTELIKHQVQFDLINKAKLLACKIEDGYLIAPTKERIKYVVIPSLDWLDNDVSEFLQRADHRGINVLFDGEKREICNVNFTKRYLSDKNLPRTELSLSKENPYILATHRAFDECDLFMLVNTSDSSLNTEVLINLGDSDSISILDQKTGRVSKLEHSKSGSKAIASISLEAYETVIISRRKK